MKTVRVTGIAIAYDWVIEEQTERGLQSQGTIKFSPVMIQADQLPQELLESMAKEIVDRLKKRFDFDFVVKFGKRGNEVDLQWEKL